MHPCTRLNRCPRPRLCSHQPKPPFTGPQARLVTSGAVVTGVVSVWLTMRVEVALLVDEGLAIRYAPANWSDELVSLPDVQERRRRVFMPHHRLLAEALPPPKL